MKNAFRQTSFSVEITKDGSPTLRLPGDGESMHHAAGAAGETRYIYKSVMDSALQLKPDSRTCVVGLGLGYIEISWALGRLAARHRAGGTPVPQAEAAALTSFEIDAGLRESFLAWLQSPAPALYDDICRDLQAGATPAGLAAAGTAPTPATLISPEEIKEILRTNYGREPLQGDLRDYLRNPPAGHRWNVVCYDAFSSRTNSDLWSAEFLQEFLERHCAPDCVLTTYACTGVLKKALAANGFEFLKRPGFSGKRDSSLGLRGVFRECSPNFFRTF